MDQYVCCPLCGTRGVVPSSTQGKTIRCRNCATRFVVSVVVSAAGADAPAEESPPSGEIVDCPSCRSWILVPAALWGREVPCPVCSRLARRAGASRGGRSGGSPEPPAPAVAGIPLPMGGMALPVGAVRMPIAMPAPRLRLDALRTARWPALVGAVLAVAAVLGIGCAAGLLAESPSADWEWVFGQDPASARGGVLAGRLAVLAALPLLMLAAPPVLARGRLLTATRWAASGMALLVLSSPFLLLALLLAGGDLSDESAYASVAWLGLALSGCGCLIAAAAYPRTT